MYARPAQAPDSSPLAPILGLATLAGLMVLGAFAHTYVNLPWSTLGDQLRSALSQAGAWRMPAVLGRAVLCLLLLSPAAALVLKEWRILLVLPLAFAMGCSVMPEQASGCYDGSLESCIALVQVVHVEDPG